MCVKLIAMFLFNHKHGHRSIQKNRKRKKERGEKENIFFANRIITGQLRSWACDYVTSLFLSRSVSCAFAHFNFVVRSFQLFRSSVFVIRLMDNKDVWLTAVPTSDSFEIHLKLKIIITLKHIYMKHTQPNISGYLWCSCALHTAEIHKSYKQ